MQQILDLKVNVRRRLEYIEFQIIWEGSIGRRKLFEQFSISMQQATLDINNYISICPENIDYDLRKKTYVKSNNFKPAFIKGDASEYFSQLEALHSGYRNEQEIWTHSLPSFDSVSIHRKKVNAKSLAKVLEAIREKSALKGKYLSLSSDGDEFRIMMPHSIANDGHRWHMRAYDYDKKRFSDFVLSRLHALKKIESPMVECPLDEDWETQIKIVLIVDPTLDNRRKEQIEYEYQMKNGRLEIKIRKAMLLYNLRYFGFDPFELEGGKMRNKSSFHLMVENLNEVEEWIGRRK